MSRDCFLLMLKFLHLTNNEDQVARGQPGHDKLFKIRKFMEGLVEKFKSVYKLHNEISIDGSMISYKGRLSFLQFMPKKPVKWGMKTWVLNWVHVELRPICWEG